MRSTVHTPTTASVIVIPSLVFLVRVEVCTVHRFHMFAQRTRICVALGAATRLAHVRLLHTQTQNSATVQN